ncbi:MAG: MFS transporter, partial [Pseudomonadota bacterium]
LQYRLVMVHASLRSVFLILVLWLAGLGAAAQFAKIAIPFSSLRALYPEAGEELGWLLSLISLLGVVFGMTAGVIVSRLGCYRLLIFALLLGAAVSLWQAALPSLTTMLVSRLIEGVSHLIIVVAAPTLIAQVSATRYRGLAMTLWSTFFGVSFAVVAWLGLPLTAAYGVNSLFLAHGLFMSAVAGLLIVSSTPSGVIQAASEVPLRFDMIWQRHMAAYRSPSISAPAIGWLFYTLTFVALLAILPDLLPAETRSLVTGVMPLASIAVALFVVSPLLAVVSASTIVMAGFLLAAAVLALLIAGMPLSYACIALFAVLGLVQGASFAAVPELNGTVEAQVLSNGAIAQLGNLGNTLGTPVLLSLQGQWGLQGLLTTVLAVYVAGCFAHMVLAYLRRVQSTM